MKVSVSFFRPPLISLSTFFCFYFLPPGFFLSKKKKNACKLSLNLICPKYNNETKQSKRERKNEKKERKNLFSLERERAR